MMTPKEVQEHGFPRSRKGYDMAEVDEFLDKLTEDYTALYTNYGKLSNSYSKLRKKAQALATALEQIQQNKDRQPAPAQVAAPAPVARPVQPVTAADVQAADDLLRAARKDAQAIRAGAERERQEIINQATNYAAENVERLKAEVAAEEKRLTNLKNATANYVGQVRMLLDRQAALLDGSPIPEVSLVRAPAPVEEAPAPKPVAIPVEEPTVRMDESADPVADEISRNIMSLRFDDEDEADDADFGQLEDAGSLFDAISANGASEFDEE